MNIPTPPDPWELCVASQLAFLHALVEAWGVEPAVCTLLIRFPDGHERLLNLATVIAGAETLLETRRSDDQGEWLPGHQPH